MPNTTVGEPACVAPAGDRCGEGPVWHPEEQALYWTDINCFLIHRFEAAHGCVKSWFFDEPVTALALTWRWRSVRACCCGSRASTNAAITAFACMAGPPSA